MGIHVDQNEFAQALRAARQQRGLSQVQLADVLGVHQSNITRWERGKDEIPRARRLELIDILQNRQDKIFPFVQHLLRNQHDLAVHNGDTSVVLREADAILNQYKINRSAVDGVRHELVYEAEWKRQIDPDLRVYENTVQINYERDIAIFESDFSARFDVECMFLRIEPYSQVMLRRMINPRPPTGEPVMVIKLLTLTDLDMWG